MKDLRGKVVVITGAGSGIGRALAIELAAQGARLALSDVAPDGLDRTTAACAELGAEVRGYPLDVTDMAAVQAHATQVRADFGGADLVVNNAGVNLLATVIEARYEDVRWVLDVNFWGVVHGTRAFLPLLVAARGHLVNISSMYGLTTAPAQTAYNAAKFAVRGFTEAVWQEMQVGGVPVTVSCVYPGNVRTDIFTSARTGRGLGYDGIRERFAQEAAVSAEAAARAILRGIRRNQMRIIVGADARRVDLSSRLLGTLYLRLRARRARAEASRLRLAAMRDRLAAHRVRSSGHRRP
ncbi:SDR family oxidoreductase [Micromonospora sp. DT48]|uniref:SDR family oxidoreductase n=1 Tax=unclassified Micromonospora TaxID=2617518 RepID=UPI0012BB5C7F|nr:SDR family NAD(P)-dependent oxidoreductase [Micromonospora sp. CP22]MTK04789.1 SDR family NAD(P)-dependent oxidoreductase [Micromonospora sp. CP22]